MDKKLTDELAWRGFINQTSYSDISVLDDQPITLYFGVDPSAPSMTIGNLASAMMVKHFVNAGHKVILLVGGATGMIGDPDGKATERDLKTVEEVEQNKAGISDQYNKLFGTKVQVVDNYDWFKDIDYLGFLRDIGKHVPMRQMLGRDFVNKRLQEGGDGISYAEFSYVLIQAYDFLYLYNEYGVTLQLCGSDQWGNSIAGVDLIRRKAGGEAHVLSTPLVVNKATGKKFGKTEEGAVWLNPDMTSVFAFYQFWLNVDDEGVEDYLKIYTMLERDEIEQIMSEFKSNPGNRIAQKRLAEEVTSIVHGRENMLRAAHMTSVLFGDTNFLELDNEEKQLLSQEFTNIDVRDDLPQMLVDAGLAGSKTEARTFIANGAINVNGTRVGDSGPAWEDGYNLIKRGKNKFAIARK